ncbi:MAG: group II intron reverse transcriptase/maturase, partial [Sweet potato little leaf phytoplasma]|nr:group II intron reverse transcriptase/maturase [Sweet potato little leaf phytoplasma]MDV3162245.1 group II intron reverse transcriptase/maturase [Sweet potato little leaf phytoplasma]
GVKGEYNEAYNIKNQVTQWLEQDLNLTISKDKSKIVKASKGTRFLSYMIKVNPTNKTRQEKATKNSLNGKV